MSIPKIIHYCWFGNKPMPDDLKRYIESWKKYLPDYRIIEWNESNFDIASNEFVKQAYHMKKYAFVSDYVRLSALYEYGGIYFDVDIEVQKPFDEALLNHDGVFCFESDEKLMTAFMAVKKENDIIKEFLDCYTDKEFDMDHMVPNTELLTDLLRQHGLKLNGEIQRLGSMIIYSSEYFNAFDLKDFSYKISENTYTIHRFYGSWCSPKDRMLFEFKKNLRTVLGQKIYNFLKQIKKKIIKEI